MSYNLSLSYLIEICMNLGAIGIFIGLFTWPLVDIFISRRFDPQFKHITKDILGLGWFLRGSWYAANMITPKRILKNPKSERVIVFGQYDLWANATRFERALACLHILPGYFGVIMAFIFGINHLIVYIRNLIS